MKNRLCFILILVFATAFSIAAQNRTVTNADLEKFRQKRLAAERDLRENYERLGFPSPEELERQIEQSRIERSELAARLRAETLEREQVNLERRRAEIDAQTRSSQQYQTQNYQSSGGDYFYGGTPYGFYSFPNLGYGFPNGGYYRGGQFNRGGFRNNYRRNYGNAPRIEYRNNIPVQVPAPPRPILAPGGGGRRN